MAFKYNQRKLYFVSKDDKGTKVKSPQQLDPSNVPVSILDLNTLPLDEEPKVNDFVNKQPSLKVRLDGLHNFNIISNRMKL